MDKRKLFVTEHDLMRLMRLINRIPVHTPEDHKYIEDLRSELESAAVVPASDVPPDVITMNSRVVLKDLGTGERIPCTLVFPRAANIKENLISVLAPIGTAMIGYRVGDVIEWQVPAGRIRLKVEEVPYQPEAAGNYDE